MLLIANCLDRVRAGGSEGMEADSDQGQGKSNSSGNQEKIDSHGYAIGKITKPELTKIIGNRDGNEKGYENKSWEVFTKKHNKRQRWSTINFSYTNFFSAAFRSVRGQAQ